MQVAKKMHLSNLLNTLRAEEVRVSVGGVEPMAKLGVGGGPVRRPTVDGGAPRRKILLKQNFPVDDKARRSPTKLALFLGGCPTSFPPSAGFVLELTKLLGWFIRPQDRDGGRDMGRFR